MKAISFVPVKKEQDMHDLQTLVNHVWREHFIPILGAAQVEYMLSNYQSEETIREQIVTNAQQYFFVTDELEQSIGYVAYYFQQETLFLSKFYLSKVARGQGIASKAYQKIEEVALSKGCKKIRLHCNRHNVHALKVYEHFGFVIFDEQVTKIGHGYVMDDYFLEKTLF